MAARFSLRLVQEGMAGRLRCCGALADGYAIDDSAVVRRLLRVMTRAAHGARRAQIRQEFFLQGPAGLNEQGPINRLV